MSKLFVYGLFLSILLAACSGSSTELRQIEELQNRVAALEAQLAAAEAAPTGAPEPAEEVRTFEVVVAQYVMNNAGFHEMAETMEETQTVDPAYLEAVGQVQNVVSQTNWPEDLQAQVDGFHGVLEELSTALEADNGEEAATLAVEAHTTGHDLSGAIDELIGAGGGDHD